MSGRRRGACHHESVQAHPTPRGSGSSTRVWPMPDELVRIGRAAGLDAVGVCTAAPFLEARAAIEARKTAGMHAGMGFTFRQPVYSTTPTMALREARSIVVGAMGYRRPTKTHNATSPAASR